MSSRKTSEQRKRYKGYRKQVSGYKRELAFDEDGKAIKNEAGDQVFRLVPNRKMKRAAYSQLRKRA